jgi:hypothetical protein
MIIKRNEKLKATLALAVAALAQRDGVLAFASEHCEDTPPDGPSAHAHIRVSIATAKARYDLGQIVTADTNVEEMMAALDRKLAEPADAPDEVPNEIPASLAEALKGLLGGNVEVEVLHVDLSGVGDELVESDGASSLGDKEPNRGTRNKELAEFLVTNPDALADLLGRDSDGPSEEGNVDNHKTDPSPAPDDNEEDEEGDEDDDEPVAYTVEDAPAIAG